MLQRKYSPGESPGDLVLQGGHGSTPTDIGTNVPPTSQFLHRPPRWSSFLPSFLSSPASPGQKDLQNKVFVFPTTSSTAVVHLHISNQQPLTKLTICLRHYSVLSRSYGLFSYATWSNSNDFLIFKNAYKEYYIYVGGFYVTFKVPEKGEPSWDHICVSWDSSNGLVRFWLNGKPFPRRSLKKGYSISQEASIMLGQDQDSFGGGFNINKSFVGEMSDVNMWPFVLEPSMVRLAKNNIGIANPLISWRSLSYTIKNEVFVDNFLSPQGECIC
ncbi:serum amyloid P-component-like [Crotalus adamanteus]|uniref:C-reactive protein n=1 Tax=Crotalus adamanteus TaxID=8729 RepID=A0AAW1ANU2_CROAD